MRAREFVAAHTFGLHYRERERITECERRGGARGGRQIERAGFFFRAGVKMGIGLPGEARLRFAGKRDQLGALAFDQRHDRQQFGGFARVRQRDKYVVARDHAEVAMARFGGMHKIRRRAGARHGRRDFARDMAGLADAAHRYAPA